MYRNSWTSPPLSSRTQDILRARYLASTPKTTPSIEDSYIADALAPTTSSPTVDLSAHPGGTLAPCLLPEDVLGEKDIEATRTGIPATTACVAPLSSNCKVSDASHTADEINALFETLVGCSFDPPMSAVTLDGPTQVSVESLTVDAPPLPPALPYSFECGFFQSPTQPSTVDAPPLQVCAPPTQVSVGPPTDGSPHIASIGTHGCDTTVVKDRRLERLSGNSLSLTNIQYPLMENILEMTKKDRPGHFIQQVIIEITAQREVNGDGNLMFDFLLRSLSTSAYQPPNLSQTYFMILLSYLFKYKKEVLRTEKIHIRLLMPHRTESSGVEEIDAPDDFTLRMLEAVWDFKQFVMHFKHKNPTEDVSSQSALSTAIAVLYMVPPFHTRNSSAQQGVCKWHLPPTLLIE